MTDTPLNPDALSRASDTISDRYDGNGYEGTANEIAEDAIRAYLAAEVPAPRRWLASTEELEALRAGSIIRSKRGIVRELFSTGWLAIGGDGINTSEDLAMIDGGHELLHDGATDE